jgi:hypothetical protein
MHVKAHYLTKLVNGKVERETSKSIRFPRVPTSVCVARDKFPGAQNFSVSPKKPAEREVSPSELVQELLWKSIDEH